MQSRPVGTSLGSVQSWVCNELGYSGRHEAVAKCITEDAMDWCAEGHLYGWGPTDSPRNECEKYLKSRKSAIVSRAVHFRRYGAMVGDPQPVGFIFGGILEAIIFNLIIGIIVKIIINWLFSDDSAKMVVGNGWHTRND